MAERWEAPRYGGCAYASSNPAEAPPKMVVKVITETVTETIRDGQAFVHKTTTTAFLTPQELQARGIVDDAREIVQEARWEQRDGVERCIVRPVPRPHDEEITESPAHPSAARRGEHGPQYGAPPAIDARGIVREAPHLAAQNAPDDSVRDASMASMETRHDVDEHEGVWPSSEDRI